MTNIESVPKDLGWFKLPSGHNVHWTVVALGYVLGFKTRRDFYKSLVAPLLRQGIDVEKLLLEPITKLPDETRAAIGRDFIAAETPYRRTLEELEKDNDELFRSFENMCERHELLRLKLEDLGVSVKEAMEWSLKSPKWLANHPTSP